MATRFLDPNKYRSGLSPDANADWHGNNVAFSCPVCSKVFVVAGFGFDSEGANGRPCPGCGKSVGFVSGSCKDQGSQARIEWEIDDDRSPP